MLFRSQVYAIEFDLIRGMKSNPGNSNYAYPKESNFVVCAYDEKHWIGIVDAVDEEHDDIKVKFAYMSPSKVVQLATQRYLFCPKCECPLYHWSSCHCNWEAVQT